MAKFCGYCGFELEDSAKVCGNCGAPADDAPAALNNKKRLLKIVSVVAILVVAAFAVKLSTGFTGYRGLLRDVMSDYEDYDIEDLAENASSIYYLKEGDSRTAIKRFSNPVKYGMNVLEDNIGHKYKFSYKVNKFYEIPVIDTNSGFRWMLYNINPYFNLSNIEKIVCADVTATAKKGSKKNILDMTVYMSKEHSEWKLLYIELL